MGSFCNFVLEGCAGAGDFKGVAGFEDGLVENNTLDQSSLLDSTDAASTIFAAVGGYECFYCVNGWGLVCE